MTVVVDGVHGVFGTGQLVTYVIQYRDHGGLDCLAQKYQKPTSFSLHNVAELAM